MIYELDYETRSEADLTKVGGFRYAYDQSTKILCVAVSRGAEDPVLWRCDNPLVPESRVCLDLLGEIASNPENLVYAHNATGFEVPITDALWEKTFGFPPPAHTQWRCTAVMARKASLPHRLDKLAEKLCVEQQKDKSGFGLIRKFCIPPFVEPEDEPDAFDRFCEYCRQDVRAEREVRNTLFKFDLKGDPLKAFQADLEMNCRGLPINLKAVANAQKILDAALSPAAEEFHRLTGLNYTQQVKVLEWVQERGYEPENLQKDTLDEWLESDAFEPDSDVGKALAIRRDINFAANKKLVPMQACAGPHDNKVRGTLMYLGASRTGRWSGSLMQIHNIKKPARHLEEFTEKIYRLIEAGACEQEIDFVYGNPLEAVASCMRHFVDDGKPMLNVDYSAIEARVIAWLAGEEWRLEVFRTHGKIYEASAASMFGVPIDSIDKKSPLRAKGKIGELACIAEGQLVLTDRGLVPIEDVDLGMLVFDGKEFVKHGGVVYRGTKEVITYDGLTATPDHIVFTEKGQTPFGCCSTTRTPILKPRPSGEKIRKSGDHRSTPTIQRQMVVLLRPSQVPYVRISEIHSSGEFNPWDFKGVSELLSEDEVPVVAWMSNNCLQESVSKSTGQGLPKLRETGYRVSLRVGQRGERMGDGQHRFTEGERARPNRQRRTLRAGKSSMVNSFGTEPKPETFKSHYRAVRLGSYEEPVFSFHHPEVLQSRGNLRRAHKTRPESCARKTEELAYHTEKPSQSRVYDILDCGPRNRFVVSGCLVHNCGFGGGTRALEVMGALEMGIPESELKPIVDAWRAASPRIVDLWKSCDHAARAAIANQGKKFKVGSHLEFFSGRTAGMNFLFLRLPSGRCLCYPEPRMEMRPAPWDADQMIEQITFYGQIPLSAHWGRVPTYGARLVENATQGTAFDLMAHGFVNAEEHGYRAAALIHDEFLGYKDGDHQSATELISLLTELPPWAKDLPLAAEGGEIQFYTK